MYPRVHEENREKWTQSGGMKKRRTHRKSRNTKGTHRDSIGGNRTREKRLNTERRRRRKKWKEDVTVITVVIEEEEKEEAIVEIEIVSKYRWSRDVGPVE